MRTARGSKPCSRCPVLLTEHAFPPPRWQTVQSSSRPFALSSFCHPHGGKPCSEAPTPQPAQGFLPCAGRISPLEPGLEPRARSPRGLSCHEPR